MKTLRNGFTVVELLLCIGIIGIVSAMGMVITKHSTDKAYNLYYYTGYINMYNAIADAKAQGKSTNEDIMEEVTKTFKKATNTANALNLDSVETASAIPHFISYKAAYLVDPTASFEDKNLPQNLNTQVDWLQVIENDDAEEELEEIDDYTIIYTVNSIRYAYRINGNCVEISMAVPQKRTRTNNGIGTVKMLFINGDDGLLVPLRPANVTDETPDLQNRADLLPTYIDNGLAGRANNGNYTPITYYSYREAYCRLTNRHALTISETTILTCADLPAPPAAQVSSGFLRFQDPRKAR